MTNILSAEYQWYSFPWQFRSTPPVFACAVGIAVILNEIAYRSGLLNEHTFNMFFVSPYCDPSLPVYSLVQAVVPFPWSLIIYIAGFSLAAYIILLTAIMIKKVFGSKQNREKVEIEYNETEKTMV